MKYPFKYETYQDVRTNLSRCAIVVLWLSGFFTVFCILPLDHRAAFLKLALMSDDPEIVNYFVGTSVPLLVLGVLAYLLVEIVKVHDRVYDRYVIKWRLRYDTDFIFPRLLKPFWHRIGDRFYSEAEKHLGDFMETLYYPYVGDHDMEIRKNLVVRFYERITIYWLTQVIEIVIGALLLVVASYHFFYEAVQDTTAFRHQLLTATLVLLVAFVLNRLWCRSVRESVRTATQAEIDDILEKKEEDLEHRLRRICQKHSIPFE